MEELTVENLTTSLNTIKEKMTTLFGDSSDGVHAFRIVEEEFNKYL